MRVGLIAAGVLSAVTCGQLAHAQVLKPAAPASDWTPAAEETRAPHHGRSLLYMSAGELLGLGGYWIFKEDNVVDWDNPQISQRFSGAAWRFDNNSIGVNFLGHPLEGALSYEFARANHQSVLGSFSYSFLTSFIWEFVFEFKEKVSVNDVMVTPGGGLPLGEFFYKLGLYLDTGHRDSLAVSVLRSTLGHAAASDRALDGRAAPVVSRPDSLGFSPEIWHDFQLRYGAFAADSGAGERGYALYRAGMRATLVTLPGYLAPRSFGRGFWGAELSSIGFSAEGSRWGTGLLATADTTLFGYHAQDLERQNHVTRGEALTLGCNLGYDYLRSAANRSASIEAAIELPEPALDYHHPNRREQYAAVQLPGFSADLHVLRGLGGFGASLRVQPSFAGLSAPAFYDWAAAHRDEVAKHILHQQGYFYGWGGALNAAVRAAVGPFRGRFELMYGAYRSQDGWDRKTEELTDDVSARGELLRYEASLGVAPGSGHVMVGLELGERRLHSSVGGYSRTARVLERGVSAVWSF